VLARNDLSLSINVHYAGPDFRLFYYIPKANPNKTLDLLDLIFSRVTKESIHDEQNR
jgi:hypothetical protein